MYRFIFSLFLVCFGLCFWPLTGFAQDDYAGDSVVGRVRPHNEDAILIMPEGGLFVVADGMGGHAAGEVASAFAIETLEFFGRSPAYRGLQSIYEQLGLKHATAGLFAGIYQVANAKIVAESRANPARRGMGTTIVSLHPTRFGIMIGNLGDSRAYRIRDRKIEQLSRDHSLQQTLIDNGTLATPEAIAAYPHKNIITKAAGTALMAEPDIFVYPQRAGDLYLLCSDGLSDELSDAEILEYILKSEGDLKKTTSLLIDAANANGGRDNISIVFVGWDAKP